MQTDIVQLLANIKSNIAAVEQGERRAAVLDEIEADCVHMLELMKLFLISERDSYYGYFLMNLTYDVDYRVRLINAQEYEIKDVTLLKGFISGLHAGNFDITHVFIEGLYKIIGADLAQAEAFVAWCEAFGKQNDMSFTVTISDDPAKASEDLKKYL